jgi:hypothetical protein
MGDKLFLSLSKTLIMSNKSLFYFIPTAVLLALTLLLTGGCATAGDSGKTIYLDPQTGAVIPPPNAQAKAAAGDSSAQDVKRGRTPDGQPRRVVRCADGSLRMGSRASSRDQDNGEPSSLCKHSLE